MKAFIRYISFVLAMAVVCGTASLAAAPTVRLEVDPETGIVKEIRYEEDAAIPEREFLPDEFREEEIRRHEEDFRSQRPTADGIDRVPRGDEADMPLDGTGDNHLSATANDEDWSSASVYVPLGGSTTLRVNVTADDVSEITYKWQKENTTDWTWEDLEEDSAELYIEDVEERTYYQCTVSDQYGASVSVWFYVYIENHLTVTANNTDRNYVDVYVPFGKSVDLHVVVSADNMTDMTFTWHYSHDNVAEYLEADSPDYHVDKVTERGCYECSVNDCYGNYGWVTFNIYVDNSLDATANDTGKTYADIYVPYGESTDLHVKVTASDMTDIKYSWEAYNGKSWETLENDSADLHVDQVVEYCRYTVNITDRYGTTKSVSFTVYVDNHLTAFANDTNKTSISIAAELNDAVDLHVEAAADDMTDLTYSWEVYDGKSWKSLENVAADLHVDQVTGYEQYECTVKDRFGTSIRVYFTVYVENHLTATAAGYGQSNYVTVYVPYGEATVLRVEVTADDVTDITYRWRDQVSWNAIDNNTPELLVQNVTGKRTFDCEVKDRYGTPKTVYFNIYVENHLQPTAYDTGKTYEYVYVAYGESADLHVNVTADDMSDITYAWEVYDRNTWTTLSGTGPDYHVEDITEYLSYNCRVTDKYGTTKSVNFYVSVENHLSAEAVGRSSQTVEPGDTVTMSVLAKADKMEGITYQWSREDYNASEGYYTRVTLHDATDASYTVPEVKKACDYYCTVMDCYGNTVGVSFHVSVENNLKVSRVGEYSQVVPYGSEATMGVMVAASNTTDLTYQWYYLKYNVYEGYYTRTRIPGATESKYTIAEVNNTYTYYCYVTDCYGNTASVEFYVAVLNNLRVALTCPEVQTIPSGGSVTMSVSAAADDLTDITYQWYELEYRGNGSSSILLPGEEKDTLTVSDVTEGKRYRCEVSDKYGNTSSVTCYICVDSFLFVERDGEYRTDAVIGTDVTLKVKVTADDLSKVVYSWKVQENGNYVEIEGASADTLKLTKVSESKYYQCIVKDANGNMMMVTYYVVAVEAPPVQRGDVNGDGEVNSNDAIYLLRHTMNSSRYPINQSGDMNGDETVDSNDAIYLLRHTMNPSRYPLI